MSSELKNFLDVSQAPRIPKPEAGERRQLAEFSLTHGAVEIPDDVPEGDALTFLEKADQDPGAWEVTGFKRIEYGNPAQPFVSTRFTYKRRPDSAIQVPIDDLLAYIHEYDGPKPKTVGQAPLPGVAVLIGDMQFGQVGPDGDPFTIIENTLAAIDRAAEEVERYGGADELLVAWLGDHVEGFVSQGGRNNWRTPLTLSEQIRATRRVMLYAVDKLSPLCNRLVMAAIPGNHGRVETATGAGTRADDNHDVEALVAVAETLQESRHEAHRAVEVYVPEKDSISLSVAVGGLTWGLVHGDKWRKGGHFTWWREQAFHNGPTAGADVLCSGHWHHLLVQEEGNKTFIQVPTLSTDGAYWEHLHGNRPHPGIVLALVDTYGELAGVLPLRVGKES